MSIENICDDPFGSAYARALDQISLSQINTLVDRRVDLTLEGLDLFPAFFVNRINSDDIPMVQASFYYGNSNDISILNSKYAEER